MGTLSIGNFKLSENGGIALAQITQYYLGNYGIVLLSLIVMVACLKTAVGLITAFPETLEHLFPETELPGDCNSCELYFVLIRECWLNFNLLCTQSQC